jgi:hypothetical protein
VGLGPGVKVGGMGITRVLVGVGGRGVQVGGLVGVAWVVGLAIAAGKGVDDGFSVVLQAGVKPKLENMARTTNRCLGISVCFPFTLPGGTVSWIIIEIAHKYQILGARANAY